MKLQSAQSDEASMLNLLPQLSLRIQVLHVIQNYRSVRWYSVLSCITACKWVICKYSWYTHVCAPWVFANDPLCTQGQDGIGSRIQPANLGSCAFNFHNALIGVKWMQSALLVEELILTGCIKLTVSTIFPTHCYRDYLECNNLIFWSNLQI